MPGLSSFNPFTGFGILDAAVEHVSAKDIQQRGADIDREMWDKQTQFAIEQFGRESEFATAQQARKYKLDQQAIMESPKSLVKGLADAGLNPILAATGGFRSSAPQSAAPTAKASAGGPSRGGSPGGARSNVAMASRYGKLIDSEVDLNSAKAEAERARAGVSDKTEKILEPVSKLMDALSGMIEQANIDRKTSQRIWQWLASELPEGEKKLTPKQREEMLNRAKKKFPQLKGVDNNKRKIFGGK